MERSYALIEQEMETLRSEIADELRPDAEQLREQGYTVRVEVQFGEPAQRIVQYVNDEAIGLVAMATHGRSGVSRLVLGSVAERVLRGSAAPVLLLRPQDVVTAAVGGAQAGRRTRQFAEHASGRSNRRLNIRPPSCAARS